MGQASKGDAESGRGRHNRTDSEEQGYWRNPKEGMPEMARVVAITETRISRHGAGYLAELERRVLELIKGHITCFTYKQVHRTDRRSIWPNLQTGHN